MSAVALPPHRVLVRTREPADRAWLERLIGGLGAHPTDLDAVPDADLFDPSASHAVVAQTGGTTCPLGRLLSPGPEGQSLARPVILLAARDGFPDVAGRVSRTPHAVLLAEPCEPEELASILRASLAAEARRHEAQALLAELRRANEELERRRQDAESEALRRTQFLAAISHDLRTPLYEIGLVAQLAKNHPREASPPADWDRLVAGLMSGVSTLRERVDDLFDLARLDLGAVRPRAAPFALGPFLERVSAPYRAEAEARGVRFAIDAPPPWTEVVADEDKLARVMQNLVSNAVKFTDAGEVVLAATIDPGPPETLTLSVRDTGRGIAPEAIRSIFDEFAQIGNPERDRTKGTGLGLAICRRLAQVLGGRIDVSSEPGRGSEFTLAVPTGET